MLYKTVLVLGIIRLMLILGFELCLYWDRSTVVCVCLSARKEMERQRLEEWERSRKSELENHRYAQHSPEHKIYLQKKTNANK